MEPPKATPGSASFGGAFRNSQGHILRIYAKFIGIENNNAVELQALEAGLNIAIRESFHMLIIEGDSQLIIQMLRRLQNGIPLSKLTTN
jgi:ribonuclease HI